MLLIVGFLADSSGDNCHKSSKFELKISPYISHEYGLKSLLINPFNRIII
jgi:hypothetical protein